MLTQTPRLLHAAALRETVCSMSARLGYCGCVSHPPPGLCMRWAHRSHSLREALSVPKADHRRALSVQASSGETSNHHWSSMRCLDFHNCCTAGVPCTMVLRRPPPSTTGQTDSSSAAMSKEVDEETVKMSVGRIDIIVGPMFAGKTSELLRRVEQHEVLLRLHPT